MKKLRIWRWYVSAFFSKHKKIILLSSTLGVILAIFIIWILPFIPRPNPMIKVGLVGQYRRHELPEFITAKVGQGLTTVLNDGTAVPAIAEDWSISNDGLTYTFFIHQNLYWQDETQITAQDFAYNFENVTQKAVDDFTLQFELESPYTPFPTLLNKPVLKNNIYGSGEYQIKKITEKSGYLDQVNLESQNEKIHIKFYPNISKALVAFKLGEIDEIRDIYVNPFKDNQQWESKIEVTSQRDTQQYVALFLNNQGPILGDKTFRQALAYVTPKTTDSSRALSPISVESWAYSADVKPYNYDQQRAKELAEKSMGSLEKLQETTLTIGTTQNFLQEAEQIKRAWEEGLGLHVDIEIINAINPNYQILLLSQEIPLDPDQYSLWHSTQSQNLIHFKNVRVDKILEDARTTRDIEERKEMYYDFQRFFVEESPIIFLSYPEIYNIKRKSIVQPFMRSILNFGVEEK